MCECVCAPVIEYTAASIILYELLIWDHLGLTQEMKDWCQQQCREEYVYVPTACECVCVCVCVIFCLPPDFHEGNRVSAASMLRAEDWFSFIICHQFQ